MNHLRKSLGVSRLQGVVNEKVKRRIQVEGSIVERIQSKLLLGTARYAEPQIVDDQKRSQVELQNEESVIGKMEVLDREVLNKLIGKAE